MTFVPSFGFFEANACNTFNLVHPQCVPAFSLGTAISLVTLLATGLHAGPLKPMDTSTLSICGCIATLAHKYQCTSNRVTCMSNVQQPTRFRRRVRAHHHATGNTHCGCLATAKMANNVAYRKWPEWPKMIKIQSPEIGQNGQK